MSLRGDVPGLYLIAIPEKQRLGIRDVPRCTPLASDYGLPIMLSSSFEST